jgi:LPS export ABC transporter protein LptC
MTRWQRHARLILAVFAVGFAIALALAFKRRTPPPPPPVSVRTDPAALVESSSGRVIRVNRTREDVTVEYQRQLTYKDGSTKLQGVTVTTNERGGSRTFTMTGKEGSVAQNDSTITLNGDVRWHASDGLTAQTEQATYAQGDGMLRAPGPAQFARNRLSGSGVGMTYDKGRDVLVIQDQAKVRLMSDVDGGITDVTAGTATVARQDKSIRFDRTMKAVRSSQVIEAEESVVHLTDDEERVERVELRGRAQITGSKAAPGELQSLTGYEMDLRYAADGETLDHVVINGDAVLTIAGPSPTLGRQIGANRLEVSFGPDGVTPIALTGREAVQLSFPPEQNVGARTIKAATLDSRGAPGKGLTSARFTGDVDYRERSETVNRVAKSGELTLALKPGMSSIDDATFTKNARFAEDDLFAVAANARYVLDRGALELSGSEPGVLRPSLRNDRIQVDAARIDVALAGPRLKAHGDVRSVLQPSKKGAAPKNNKAETKVPSMLKDDQVVYVVGDELDYDSMESKAAYAGHSKLWQADTSIQAEKLEVDNSRGDLAASGSVATSTMLALRSAKDKTNERSRSTGTSKAFKYEEADRRATYTGDAHLSGPQGDMTAAKIELYLKSSGDEVERAEAYDALTLREQNRKTTGARMTYTTADETYVVTGLPVTILDQCGRETVGRKLTFVKATDTINVDGSGQIRTQTKGGGTCQ